MRRAITWAAIACYALLASGLPLPVGLVAPGSADPLTARRLAGKDRSRPFPCMDKPCGCATAEQCYADCCCHTPAERLAWARAHAVEAAVVEALERRVAASRPEGCGGCCAVASRPPCCAEAEPDSTACCAVRPAESVPAEPPMAPASRRSVSLRAMLSCGGIVAQWCGIAASPPPPRVEPVFGEPPRATVSLADEVADDVRGQPAAPPPRAA